MKYRTFLKLALLLLMGLLIVFVFLHKAEFLDLVQTHLNGVDRNTAAAAYLGISIVVVVMMIPISVFMVFSGAYFGLWLGFGLNLLGFICGSTAAFLIARHLARDQIIRFLPASVLRILDKLGDSGWKTVAALRAIGIVPGVLVNYAVAITAIPLRTFVWASLVFTMPNDFILTYAGVAGADFVKNGEMGKLLMATTLFAAACVLGYLMRKRFLN